jgi:4-amino-4-deoxy-L-arabinose transferase-like glycosyltransferase
MLKTKYQNLSIYLLLLVSLYFIFFQQLDRTPLRNYDEAFYAVNACEMISNHNYFVPYYKNAPDMIILKPLLSTWLQVLCIKLIGYNELAVRLPSAIAGAFSALVLFSFIRKRSSLILALSVFFVFITSYGVAGFHTGRTGDTDSLLAFCMLCSCLSFYKWLFENKGVSLFYFFVFLSLAFLTKSFVALFIAPALLIAVLYFKKTATLFKEKWFYIGALFFVIISSGSLLIRELYNPGYLKYLFEVDFFQRYTISNELHAEPPDFYFNRFFEVSFLWFMLVLPGAFLMWQNKSTRSLLFFLSALFFSYFSIISSSVSKVYWYDLPLYPILSVFSGYAIYIFIIKTNLQYSAIQAGLMLFFIFAIPYYFKARDSYKSDYNPAEHKLEILNEFIFKNKSNLQSLNGVVFYTNYFDRPLYFYKYCFNQQGFDFSITSSIDNIKPNSTVIVAEDSLIKVLNAHYKTQVIGQYKSVLKVKI